MNKSKTGLEDIFRKEKFGLDEFMVLEYLPSIQNLSQKRKLIGDESIVVI